MGDLMELAKQNPVGLAAAALATLSGAVAAVVKLLTKRSSLHGHTLADQRYVDGRIKHKLDTFETSVNLKLARQARELRAETDARISAVLEVVREHIDGTASQSRELGELATAVKYHGDGLDRLERGQEALTEKVDGVQAQIAAAVKALGDELRKLKG